MPAASADGRKLKLVDQFHKVTDNSGESVYDNKDISRSAETEVKAREEDAVHEKNVRIADAYWSNKAKEKDW